jgi:peroxiredoxin
LLKEKNMTIKVGDKLPDGTLYEMGEDGPKPLSVAELTQGKRVVFFGLPGAFTPTCSALHVPGYVAQADQIKAKGVDEIVCVSVNDAFVMGAWGKDQKVGDKVRMLGDGSGLWTKGLGLELDLIAKGLGLRCERFSMLVENGVVKSLNVEAPGKFEVSDAQSMLNSLAAK